MLLPDTELREDDARMTMEQVQELGEALTILSSQSSIIKERDELKQIKESSQIEAVRTRSSDSPASLLQNGCVPQDAESSGTALGKRLQKMLDKIDKQLDAYESKVGSSLQLISCDPQGRIAVKDLKQALRVIRHAPDEDDVEGIVAKLDVDKDGFVQLEHVLELAKDDRLGECVGSRVAHVRWLTGDVFRCRRR